MSQQFRKDPRPVAPPDAPSAERKSGRVQFDERGQAVWEWAVKTGMFDRNASTERIKALTEHPGQLSISETPTPKAAERAPSSGNPYERAPMPKMGPRESAGGDPYSRGPAKRPETMTFNPHERNAARPGDGGGDPYARSRTRKP